MGFALDDLQDCITYYKHIQSWLSTHYNSKNITIVFNLFQEYPPFTNNIAWDISNTLLEITYNNGMTVFLGASYM